MDFTGTSGDDTLTGTTGDDLFKVYQGGNDTVSGLTGSDVFNFAGTLTAADTIDGGGGQDTVQIKGDYSGGLVFSATTMVNVETLTVGAGFNYTITTDDATVAAGAVFTLNAAALAAPNYVVFNGSAETNGLLHFHGGAGDDTVGIGSNMVADDHFDGGDGNDELLLGGVNTLTFKSVTIHNIETIELIPGFGGSLAFNSGNVLAGQTIEIDGSSAGGDGYYTINGHNLPGNMIFDGGEHDVKVTGGSGNDTFNMGAVFTRDDRLAGGTGNDTLNLNGAYNVTLAGGTITGIDQVNLAGGHSYHITSNGNLATDQTMTVNATGLTASDSLFLDFSSETLGSVILDGGAAPAILKGGQQGDAFDFAVTSQGGLVASDQIDGQGGYDRLYFDGDYTGAHALTMNATTVTNVEEFDFNAGHSYNITIDAATPNDNFFTADASQLGAGDVLTFNSVAANDASVITVIGGAGNDVLTGGENNSTIFDLSHGGDDTVTGGDFGGTEIDMGSTLTAADRLDGGTDGAGGAVVLDGNYKGANALTLDGTTLKDMAEVVFRPGHSYTFTWTGALPTPSTELLGFKANGGELGAADTMVVNFAAATGLLRVIGGAGDDHITANAATATIDLSKGGNDTVNAAGGTVTMGAALTSGDKITNVGTIKLAGNYDAADGTALNLTTANLTGGGQAILAQGFNYDITVSSTNVLSSITATMAGNVTFDGSAETTHGFTINLNSNAIVSPGPTSTITTGGGDDTVTFSNVQVVTFHGNGGNDTINFGSIIQTSQLDGGAGNDTLNFGLAIDQTFTNSSISNIETLNLAGSNTATLTMADGNVAAGQTLAVHDSNTLGFDGSAETDGHFAITCTSFFNVVGGALSDTITATTASAGGNAVTGGGGADTIDLGAGTGFTTLHYNAVADSTSVNYDTVKHVNFTNDVFALTPGAPTGIDTAVTAGALSTATFDANLAAAIGSGQLAAHHAVLFTANSGTLSGHTFLVVDENGTAGYQASADLVIDVTGAAGTLATSSFS